MASRCPNSIDVTEYQFKLQDKVQVFNPTEEHKSNISLLASASNYGLIFIGDPNKREIKVIRVQNLINVKENNEVLLLRPITTPSIPNCIAVSCDNSLLAVGYVLNGSAMVSFYNVPSFLSANTPSKFNIRASGEDNVQIIQMLWNPVIPNVVAILLNNGALGIYTLRDSGFEFHSLEKAEQAKCACWSPKGKQIVVGFPNGKLVQYKPDLKPARTINCPNNIHEGPFNTIALQWLSTYQFAAVFLQEVGDEPLPVLYIVNAPKTAEPTYICYSDICYSQYGPRDMQIFFIHIQPWNILVMMTSNSMEGGILGTKETGENPTWIQYTTLDEARIELPLTSNKDDTYPIGFTIDTSSVHQLVVGENTIPVMPMIHILSTHGMLITYNFLNLTSGAPGICSPPQLPSDLSGLELFKPISEILSMEAATAEKPKPAIQTPTTTQASDISFSVPMGATSTPAIDKKTKPPFSEASVTLFGNTVLTMPQSTASSNFLNSNSNTTSKPVLFGTRGLLTGLFGQPSEQPLPQHPTSQPFGQGLFSGTNSNINQGTSAFDSNQLLGQGKSLSFGTQDKIVKPSVQKQESVQKAQPLYTVPNTFSVMNTVQSQPPPTFEEDKKDDIKTCINQENDQDINNIVKELFHTQIETFDLELREMSNRYKNMNTSLGNVEEYKEFTKKLNELQKFYVNVSEGSMESDIQALRHSLIESFAMVAEVKSKLLLKDNPEIPSVAVGSFLYQTNRRQLAKLQSLVATNEAQLQIIQQQLDAQWANYQDYVRKNSKIQMHIPSLEGIFQTMIKQKDILARHRVKLNYLKSKLGIKGLLKKDQKRADIDVESLTDSILSMTLSDVIKTEKSHLTDEKLNTIKNILQGRPIIKIKPQRSDRVGLNSEVILEKKIKSISRRDGAITKPEKMERQRIKESQVIITKPTATKPIVIANLPQQNNIQSKKVEPKIQSNVSTSFQKTTSKEISMNLVQPQNQQQSLKDKSFSNFSLPPATVSFAGTSFVKPTDTSTVRQQTSGQNLFSGIPFSSNSNIFAVPKPDLSQQITSTENKGSSNLSDTKGIEKSKPTTFSFGAPNETVDSAPKEKNGTIFAHKVIGNESKPILDFAGTAFSVANKTKELQKHKEDVKDKKELPLISKSETTSTNNSSFASISLISSDGDQLKMSDQKSEIPSFANKVEFSKPPITTSSISFGTLSPSLKLPEPTSQQLTTSSNTTAQQSSIGNTFTFSLGNKAATSASSSISWDTTATTSSFSFVSSGASLNTKSSTVTTSAPTFSFPSFNLGESSTTTILTTPPTEADTETTTSDITDSLFGNLNICKPTALTNVTTDAEPASSNVFAGSLFNSTNFTVKSMFEASTTATSTTTVSLTTTASTNAATITTFNFGAPLSTGTTSVSVFPISSSSLTSAPISTQPVTSPSNSISVTAADTSTFVTGTTAPIAFGTVSTNSTTQSYTAQTTISSSSPFGLAKTSAFSLPTASTAIFGSAFGHNAAALTSTAPSFGSTASTSNSIFGGTSTTTTAFGGGLFSGTATTTSLFATSPITSSASAFSSTPTTGSSGNIFGGIPKPDQSVFSTTTTSSNQPFGTINQGAPLFGSSPTSQQSSGGNIFGSPSGTIGFGSQSPAGTGSIFGGGTAVSQPSSPFGASVAQGGSIFGIPKSEPSTNLFNTSSQTNQTTGGSIFGTSTFGSGGQSTGSIFGGNSAATETSPFGSTAFGQPTSSPFGTPTQQSQTFSSSGGSIFGQNSFGNAFGGQSSGFGSTSPGGSFVQGGPSIAQTGFGSGFSKPTFGAPPTFGSNPTFGGAPSFGGGPVFGNQKPGFGSFGSSNPGAFSPPTQKNNLFEALGSTDTGLSFGNLAQNANANANKTQFGGSSFSNWR